MRSSSVISVHESVRLLIAAVLMIISFSCKKDDAVTNPQKTVIPPSQLLSAPYYLTATAVSVSEIDLQWKDSMNDNAGFIIQATVDTTGVWTVIDTIGKSYRIYHHTSLLCNTEYIYRMFAYNGTRVSYTSNFARATTFLSTIASSSLNTTADLFALKFISPLVGFAGGGKGHLQSTSDGGATWDSIGSGTTASIYGIAFLNGTIGKFVGSNGTIMGSSDAGMSCNPEQSGVTSDLNSIAGIDSAHWVAVGASGVILYTSDGGTTWERRSTPSSISFNSVAFATPLTGYIVGSSAAMLVTSDGGISWANKTLLITNTLTSIIFGDSLHGLAVGSPAVILRSVDGGFSWMVNTTPVFPLTCVAFSGISTAVAVGSGGSAYASNDGGVSWVRGVLTGGASLQAVASLSASDFLAIGTHGSAGLVSICGH